MISLLTIFFLFLSAHIMINISYFLKIIYWYIYVFFEFRIREKAMINEIMFVFYLHLKILIFYNRNKSMKRLLFIYDVWFCASKNSSNLNHLKWIRNIYFQEKFSLTSFDIVLLKLSFFMHFEFTHKSETNSEWIPLTVPITVKFIFII